MQTPETVLLFWFHDLAPEQQFNGGSEIDQLIAERFKELHLQASQGELDSWRSSIQGRLAEIILLDQFSRNIYRGQAKSFAFDSIALVLSQEALKTERAQSDGHPVKWTRKYNKIFRERFADFWQIVLLFL